MDGLRARAVTAWTTRVRILTGMVLLAYITTHLLNHALGLISLEAMEAGRLWMLALWRNPAGTVLLAGSLLIHLILGLQALWRRRLFRGMTPVEIAQLVLGLAIPFMLAEHIIANRLGLEVFGTDDTYARVLTVLWLLAPEKGLVQAILLVVAWSHGCIGLHRWLRLRPGYGPWAPWLLAAGILVPALALLGFVEGGRDAAILWNDPATREVILAGAAWPDPRQGAFIGEWAERTRLGLGLLLLLVLAGRLVRNRVEAVRGLARVRYPDGTVVSAPRGTTVLDISRSADLPHASVCGGRGRCSTCRVRVGTGLEALPPPSGDESRVLARVGAAPDVRLACQIRPTGEISVTPLLPASAGLAEARARGGGLQGEDREIAILFADLRGFTRFAEPRLPWDVVFVLNRYFAAMGEAVEAAGGRLDKFIGDGVMALFGVDVPADVACGQALDAARRMSTALADLNSELAHDLDEPLRIGIGIHTGHVIVGEMGWGRATGVTAIGDAVNTASRLEALSKEFGCQFVVSARVVERAGVDFSGYEVREATIRGRRDPLAVHLVPDARELPIGPAPARPGISSGVISPAAAPSRP